MFLKLFLLCNACFYLWAFHVRPAQSCGCFENTQCFGERVLLLQPPLLLHCSHFPEKLLPGLTGLPELPGRQWEPQEVRGGVQTNPPLFRLKRAALGLDKGDEMGGGRVKPFFCWDGSSRIRVGCPNLLTPSFIVLYLSPFSCLSRALLYCINIFQLFSFFLHHFCSWTCPLPVLLRSGRGC